MSYFYKYVNLKETGADLANDEKDEGDESTALIPEKDSLPESNQDETKEYLDEKNDYHSESEF
jgi:hypothetical protein